MSEGTRSGRPVSLGALIARINRKLRREDRMLKVSRGDRWRSYQGDMYVLDVARNQLVDDHVNPVILGRELGVLSAHDFVDGWEK